MDKPSVSVIMPAYNHERFVGPAIESVLGQTVSDFELVIVDDGSTDRTAEVIRGFRDPRIRYHHQKNQDAYNALNRGMELATGRHFSILNSDDVYHPERLARCLAAIQSGAAAVITGVAPIDDTGAPIAPGTHYWHLWHARNREHYRKHQDLYTGFLRGNLMVTTSNLFMTADAARQVGGFAPLRYLHDYDYIFRLLLAFPGQVAYVEDDELILYRIHGANTLKQGAVTAREQDLALIRKYALLGVDPASRSRVETAIDRTVELNRELDEVRRALRWGRWKPLADAVVRRLRG